MMFRYVSNAGIIFDIGDKIVGIDCLCRDSAKIYQDTPLKIREALNVDVLIFTHEHEDHFCAAYVKDAWEKNHSLQIYSTKEAIEILQAMELPTGNLHQVADGDVLNVGSARIQFLKSVHEGPQYADVENLSLLITYNEEKVVVTGDAMPCETFFRNIKEWEQKIDWFFAPFPYVGLRSARKLMKEQLDIHNIIVLHLPRKEADIYKWEENTRKMCELAKDDLPKPIFPKISEGNTL